MAYRNIVIENPAHISVKNTQLVINTDAEHTVPLEDISALMLESRQSTVTSAALAAMTQSGALLYVCDDKHLPCGVLTSFSQHSRQLAVFKSQTELTQAAKNRAWRQLVSAKIANQALCLELCGKAEDAKYLKTRIATVKGADDDNAEATAAAYYFTALFGDDYTRRSDDGRNSALNYGYAILRGAVARSLAAYGFQPCLGVHHCSELNAFNLADDVIEPFRPVVDLFVAANVSSQAALEPPLKRALFNLLNADIISGAQHHSVAYAVERTVQSLTRYVQAGTQQLVLPTLISLAQHKYE